MFFLKLSSLFVFLALVVYFAPDLLNSTISNAQPVHINIADSSTEINHAKYIAVKNFKIPVYLADTEEKRTKGLGGLPSIPNHYGMFFVFDNSDYLSIWMKDVFFPIDIVWIDENLSIVHIKKDISPHTFPSIFTAPVKARYVLEMNAGMSEFYHLKTGEKIIFE